MAQSARSLRDWHRLFGLLLTDFFSDSPFVVEVERDLSVQQQLLDVVIVRRRGRFRGRLPDGLEGLVAHNLVTFKSHHEALDAWAVKELVGHYVAYRKLVSRTPAVFMPEEHFGLYAVCARLPHNLAGQVPWQRVQAGVYDCGWGTDRVRVIVAGELPREPHNAPLHLFSARAELVRFGGKAYQRRSERSSALLEQLFEGLQQEGVDMTYTMEDFTRQFVKDHFARLTGEERRAVWTSLPRSERLDLLDSLPLEEREALLQGVPPEERLAGLSAKQIREYLDQLTAGRRSAPRKPRRKK